MFKNSVDSSTFKFKANGGLFEGEGYNVPRNKPNNTPFPGLPPFLRYPTSSRLNSKIFKDLIDLLKIRHEKQNENSNFPNQSFHLAIETINAKLNEKFEYYARKDGGMGRPLVEVKDEFPFFNLKYIRSKVDIRKWQKVVDYELAFWGHPERIEGRKKGEKKYLYAIALKEGSKLIDKPERKLVSYEKTAKELSKKYPGTSKERLRKKLFKAQ